MNDFFTHDQTTTLITTLLNSIKSKNFEIEMDNDHISFLRDCIDQKDKEIDALKAKLKDIKATKKPKVTKVAKEPKVALPAPVKRGRGRPKKAVK